MLAEEKERRPGEGLLARVADRVPELDVAVLQVRDVLLDGDRLFAVLAREFRVVARCVLLLLEHLHEVVPDGKESGPAFDGQAVEDLERGLQLFLGWNKKKIVVNIVLDRDFVRNFSIYNRQITTDDQENLDM